jgi:hypothetical protein
MQTHTVLPVITMFAAQLNAIHFKSFANFPQINNLPTTSSDSANGVSQPKTRNQDTHYAITTQADVFTNILNVCYDLG